MRAAKERGADGLKLIGPMDRDQAAAAIDEAKKVGLPTTVHIAVGEATARDFVDVGVNCIEHFYGIADAALDGVQDFPPEMNLSNEIHRFGRAGELYTQDESEPREALETSRRHGGQGRRLEPDDVDLRGDARSDQAQNLPWYKDYLHPSLEEYYKPSMTRHAHVLSRLDGDAGSEVAEELPGVDGDAARVRPAKAARSPSATTPDTCTDRSTASAPSASSSCSRKPASRRSK